MPADAVDDQSEKSDQPRRYTYAPGESRSRNLAAAAVLVGLEGLAALGFSLTWGYFSLAGRPLDQTASLMGAVFATLGGLLLVRMAVALWKVEVWPRVPTIVVQLIMVPIGWSLAFTLGNTLVGVPILLVAIALLVLLLSAQVREGYGRDV